MADTVPRMQSEKVAFWTRYRTGIGNCHFPQLSNQTDEIERRHTKMDINISGDELKVFCDQQSVSLYIVFKLVWGLVLGQYVVDSHVGFNFVSQRDGRNSSSLVQVYLERDISVSALLQKLQADSRVCEPYRMSSLSSLSEIWDANGPSEYSIMNSALCINDATGKNSSESLCLDGIQAAAQSLVGISVIFETTQNIIH